MVDREARHDDIELALEIPPRGQRLFEIVTRDLDARVACESFTGPAQHLVTEVDTDTGRAGPRREHQAERDAVAGSEIEHPLDALRQQLAQHFERVDTVRQRSRARAGTRAHALR